MNRRWLRLLYKSFDLPLTEKEQVALDDALSHSLELQQERVRIQNMRGAISHAGEHKFRPFFAERVISNLSLKGLRTEQSEFFLSLVYAFRRVALLGTVAMLLLLSFNLLQSDRFTVKSVLALPDVSMEEVLLPADPLSLEEIQ